MNATADKPDEPNRPEPPGGSKPPAPPLMRSLGAFFGHIARGIRTDPAEAGRSKTEVRRTVEEEQRGDVVYRRTTIDEVEVRKEPTDPPT